jgi:hypothetical protein
MAPNDSPDSAFTGASEVFGLDMWVQPGWRDGSRIPSNTRPPGKR